ncbi:membrane protein [Mycobacteroides saopaulense]|uniref:MMPL family transporter n=1 Tax=Mycobacteroides saopaulense TaxID=1578165 RepID=UPI000720617B|nr:MMPL family transporter [Mycobacteroides saopaulense]ALR11419.1 membrane protein [Mycobacteroides saopaulense]
MLAALTNAILKRPTVVLVLSVLAVGLLGVLGADVSDKLQAGGSVDPTSESSRALEATAESFGRGGYPLVLAITVPEGQQIDNGPAKAPVAAYVAAVTSALRSDANVQRVESLWQEPTMAAALRSKDGQTGLILASIAGGEAKAPLHAKAIVSVLPPPPSDVDITAGGLSIVYAQINEQSAKDLLIAEAVAIPITFLVLVWVFGGLVSAAIPLAVGIAAIAGTAGLLSLITRVTDVSTFALNLTTALGLALAIDYTLLVLSRYREEVSAGRDAGVPAEDLRARAIVRTMTSAGRTIVFSAVTVGLSLAAMAIFPMYFLRSFAYAGVSVVALAAVVTLVVTPAILALLGERVDSLRLTRRRAEKPLAESFWFRSTRFVQRHAIPVGAGITVLLLSLGAPFLGIHFGYPDDRVLPKTSSAHQVGDMLRTDFSDDSSGQVQIVLPDVGGPSPVLAAYGANLSRIPDVGTVTGPDGIWRQGQLVGPGDPSTRSGNAVLLNISSDLDPSSESAEHQLTALREVKAPVQTLFGGTVQLNRDSVDSILGTTPLVLTVIAITTFTLLFLLTGSVLLPIKALVMNALSLSAAFGALVFVFQDGHLGGLGTTVTGAVAAPMPILMFCVTFGLSMDYEVFLLSRIKEYWDASPVKDRPANDDAVAHGIARTGRVVTAAAVLMAVVFAGIGTGQVSFMRMAGLGMTIAVLLDATLVRMLLLPAFMRIAGTVNWWAPRPLARLHARWGLTES